MNLWLYIMSDTICLDSCSETEEPQVKDDCISLNSDSDIYSEEVRVMCHDPCSTFSTYRINTRNM